MSSEGGGDNEEGDELESAGRRDLTGCSIKWDIREQRLQMVSNGRNLQMDSASAFCVEPAAKVASWGFIHFQ